MAEVSPDNVTAGFPQARETLDLLDTGIVRLDAEGRVRMMNSAAEQCLLIGRDRARGQRLAALTVLPPELDSVLGQIPEEGAGVRLHELKLSGSIYDCTIQWLDDGGVLLELHDLEWEQMRLRLHQREVQIGMLELLSRNLGHEVRNPLGGIRGAAQMLADELGNGELKTLARLIMRESDRIDELIRRFGHPELDRREIDLYPLLDEALGLLRAEFGEEIRVERDFDPSIPPIRADATAIRQVILNLLRNAYQAEARTITVRTRVEHGSGVLRTDNHSVIRLDVIDDGVGVPESLQSLLFLPLVTGRRDGTGLGLALSQQIAFAHGGLLAFEPLAEGSCFSLYLPFGKRPTPEEGV